MVYLGERPIAGFGTVKKLNYTDSAVEGQFVTSVSQEAGIISVTRAALSAKDTEAGINEAKAYVDQALSWGALD